MKHWSSLRLAFAALVIGVAATGQPSPALSDDRMSDSASLVLEQEVLRLGGSCAALAYIDEAQLRSQLLEVQAHEARAFCYPEEPFDCSDYTSFLKGSGSLSASEDAPHYCALSAE